MNYKTIYNYPKERQRIFYTWCYWDGAFTDEELTKMCAYFDTQGVERSTIVGKVEKDETGKEIVKQKPDENVRVSNVKFYDWNPANADTAWIFQRMNFVIEAINNQYYGFELNGYDTFQYTEYESSENGKYDWHMDTILGKNKPNNFIDTRKLSVTMCVNEPGDEYEGGEFQINNGIEKECETITTKKGRMIIFPSFMIHRVAPVTKGKRKSIVVWVEGPKFK
jgi:PKHD-type hydroxylase